MRMCTYVKQVKAAAGMLAAIAVVLTACSTPGAEAPAPTAAHPATAVSASTAPAGAASGQIRLVLASGGNTARYKIREQLADLDFPSDAIGETTAITGLLVITGDGQVVKEDSKFTVELKTLQSDKSMRDRFIQRNTLQTGSFPLAEFAPSEAIGIPSPPPTSGNVAFQLVGDMTVHGVTHTTTWDVTGQVNGQEITGQASTVFHFADFGLEIPRVMRVISVEDSIRLEYDFHLVPESQAGA